MRILQTVSVVLSLLAALAAPARADPVWTSDMPRISADPAADAVADNEGSCSGTSSIDNGFVEMTDVDGDGVNDLLLDYGRLRCDDATRYCGSAGCRLDVWLAGPGADWQLVLRDTVEDAFVPMPGVLVTWLDSGTCDTPRICFKAYDAWGGTLRLLEPGPEVGPAP